MKRVFIAIKVEAEDSLLRIISSLKSGLPKESVKWTSVENIHITLAFLGDTDENTIDSLISMLKKKCVSVNRFVLAIRGIGVFRNMSDPRIIWTGIEQSANLIMLNNLILEGLRDLNIRIEDRPFRPHLTLGRIKHSGDKEILKSVVERYQNTEIQTVTVNEIHLYESILLPSGPVYKSMAQFNFGISV
jgi:RNA 2',3'-cyclic 3'-phosphodiesterase